jgi:hypothetical protein
MGLPNLRYVLRLFSENKINVDDQHFNVGESKQGAVRQFERRMRRQARTCNEFAENRTQLQNFLLLQLLGDQLDDPINNCLRRFRIE